MEKDNAKKRFKLLLINPLNKRKRGMKLDLDGIYPPMAFGIIAALTPSHWDVEILDENFTEFEYKEADLVAFTSLTATINRCYELATEYRKNRIPTVIGGIHASVLPQEALQYFNTVVVGEAEGIWPQLIDDFEKKRMQKLYHAKLTPLHSSPPPRIDLYNPNYVFGTIQTTRGCPMSCEFCSVHTFNGSKYRLRPVEEAVRDFIAIEKERIYIVDDNFVGYSKAARDHAVDFLKKITELGAQKDWVGSASMNIANDEELLKYAALSGCKMIFLGIESELIDQLEQSNKHVNLKIGVDKYAEVYKRIHKYKMAIIGAFIFGLENDTPETLHNRTSYILDSDLDIFQSTILTPLPGTALYKRFEEEGRLIYTDYPNDWERYNYTEVVYRPQKMSVAEFEQAALDSWDRLYDVKTLKKKFLKSLKMSQNPTTAAWAITTNLHLRNFALEGKREAVYMEEVFPEIASGIK